MKTSTHPSQEPLKAKWDAGQLEIFGVESVTVDSARRPISSVFTMQGVKGIKYMGELEINNLRILQAQSRYLTDADRLNGLAWDGPVVLSFAKRQRANYILAEIQSQRENPEREAVKEWVSFPEQTPLPPFSRWEEEEFKVNVQLINNKWQVDIKTLNEQNTDGGAMLKDMRLPSLALKNTGSGSNVCGVKESSCQSIKITTLPPR